MIGSYNNYHLSPNGIPRGSQRWYGLVYFDSDTLMAARSQPNDNWGSVGNGAKHGEKHVGGGSGM